MDLSFQTSGEALQIAEESGDIFSKGIPYVSQGISSYGKGLLEEAKKHLLKGIEFCEQSNNLGFNANAHSHLGITYFEMGNFSKSKEHYED